MRWYVLLLALVAIATAPAAAEPKRPTARWVMDFGEAQCVATRNYGSESNPLFLALKVPPLGEVLQIGTVRNGRLASPRQLDGEIILDGGQPIPASLLEYGVKALGQRALITNLPTAQLGSLRQARNLQIRVRDTTQFRNSRIRGIESRAGEAFALAQLPRLLDLLAECATDLRERWNVGTAEGVSPKLRQPPKGSMAGLIRDSDYPSAALGKEQGGTVAMAVLIDERGRVADCTVISTSGVASLDAQSCALIKERARFTPAVGLDGRPAKSAVQQRIAWRLSG